MDNYLDRGHGRCLLRRSELALVIQNALLFFDDKRYRMMAWCVMPNHVHVLFEPMTGFSLSEIVHSWKSFTANRINELLHENGQLWQEDYFDRFVRNEAHLHRALHYIEHNPVKAGLCHNSEDWPWSSASLRSAGILPALEN